MHLGREPIERIYSSPYWRYASALPVRQTDALRCLQTASPVAEALKLRILVEAGIACVAQFSGPVDVLSEWYGPVKSGWHPRPPAARVLEPDFPLVDAAAKPESLLVPTQLGETVPELHERARRALELLIASIENEPAASQPRAILLVSHAAYAHGGCSSR